VKIPLDTKVRIPDGVLVQELQGESVLLNVNTESYYGLDEVGTRMWVVLSEASSIGDAIDTLLAEYEVERTALESDVNNLLIDLQEKKLVELS
jgi:hypothetical protein